MRDTLPYRKGEGYLHVAAEWKEMNGAWNSEFFTSLLRQTGEVKGKPLVAFAWQNE